MKLGIAYNIFDGTENLEKSVFSFLPFEKRFICGVYQSVSNHGEMIKQAFDKPPYFDFIQEYTPNLQALPSTNEIAKRNIGKLLCERAECDYFMTVDCDEIYCHDQIANAFEIFVSSGCDASACQMLTYYGDENHVFDPPEEYYVPLFYKLDKERKFHEPTYWNIVADPTRKLPSNNILVFDRSTIQMHHYSWIRNDIGLKIRNSSAKRNWSGKVEEMTDWYKAWKPGMKGYCAGEFYNLREIQNHEKPVQLRK